MPTSARKAKGGGYDIVQKKPGGGTKKIGHSATKTKAKASARIRDQAAGHTKSSKRKR